MCSEYGICNIILDSAWKQRMCSDVLISQRMCSDVLISHGLICMSYYVHAYDMDSAYESMSYMDSYDIDSYAWTQRKKMHQSFK